MISPVREFHKKIENCVTGKYLQRKRRAGSAISVQEPNPTKVEAGRKVVLLEHPLLKETPDEWKNIPTCLSEAIKTIIASIVDGN